MYLDFPYGQLAHEGRSRPGRAWFVTSRAIQALLYATVLFRGWAASMVLVDEVRKRRSVHRRTKLGARGPAWNVRRSFQVGGMINSSGNHAESCLFVCSPHSWLANETRTRLGETQLLLSRKHRVILHAPMITRAEIIGIFIDR